MAEEEARVHTLTIFLMKEAFTSTDQCLKADARVKRHAVADEAGKNIGELVIRQSRRQAPKWIDLFQGSLDLSSLFNASTSAAFFVRVKDRTFVLTFGHGRHLLTPGSWEEQFGLRVTLNTVDANRLVSVDRKTFDAIGAHSRTQTTQAAGVAAFGLNVEQDLLCAATGEPIDKSLGRRITGMDALTAVVQVRLGGLPKLLAKYLKAYGETRYRDAFPWIDHIGEVRDATLREALDARLVELLRHGDLADMRAWLCVPQLIEWANVGGFRYTDSGDPNPDLHLRDFFATLRDRTSLTVATLKQRRASALDAEGENVALQWPIYACLYCELEDDGTMFLLTGGKWYRVKTDFVGSVNEAVTGLVRRAPLALPAYKDADETAYNLRAASGRARKLVLLDFKLIRVGGSMVEACDLLGPSNELIHVKRYTGSAALSHLFAQGAVAAQALLQDSGFRLEFNRRVPASRRIARPSERLDSSAYEVVYAIISKSAKPIDRTLPFFSRLNLRTAAKQLQGFGFRVSLVKIPALDANA